MHGEATRESFSQLRVPGVVVVVAGERLAVEAGQRANDHIRSRKDHGLEWPARVNVSWSGQRLIEIHSHAQMMSRLPKITDL